MCQKIKKKIWRKQRAKQNSYLYEKNLNFVGRDPQVIDAFLLGLLFGASREGGYWLVRRLVDLRLGLSLLFAAEEGKEKKNLT